MNLQPGTLQQEQTKLDVKPKVLLLIIGIIFIGANLRAPLTSVGPLVPSIRESLGISSTLAGALTTVPLLAFALVSPFAPKLARRFGMESVLFLSLILLTIGIILRPLSGVGTLFTGTIFLGLAIAIGNVLVPSIIKQNFSQSVGTMTGIYSVSMNLCGAIASGLSIPISSNSGFGWQGSLGYWGIISIVAILFWIPQIRAKRKQDIRVSEKQQSVNIWKSGLAWQVTVFMGLQSLIFYTIVAWLPEILQQQGLSSSTAGWMLSLMQFAVLPFTFIVPIIAGRMKNQYLLVTITALLFIIGMIGILYGNLSLIPLSVIFLGIGGGCAFSLAMMFFSLRTKNSYQAAELSGMAQSIGYLLAAVGPTLFGVLHDITHNWAIPLWMLVITSVLIFISGIGAGRNKYIEEK
ncbi:transporter [Heyndrickxia shackletonii]|uniref:Transporter n=1 Tax=Heyndrickxia shackletonii TaxID=157838 RepID=A0A0Q3WUL6_9BACI|nr:MFS transporter [Heyndrickxia shackletonii]KQL52260.1 transporter [Heyndrickxia shackletonii]NEZ00281.1 MFS transporter [Heyndrickxia shackletonii]